MLTLSLHLIAQEQGVLLNSLAATYKEQNSIFLEQALCVCVCVILTYVICLCDIMQSLNLIKPLLADEITCGHNTKSPALVYTVYSSFSLVSVQVPQADHDQQHQQQTQSYRQVLAILSYSIYQWRI